MQIRTDHFEDFYDIYEDLGSGQFAVVKRCKNKDSCVEYAAKFVIKRRPGSRKGLLRDKILQEVEILSDLKHSNIISLHEVYETDHEVILVLELVAGGELFDYISEKDHLSEEEAAHFITQLLEGIDHFHSKHILHLDLKPENVMLQDRKECRIKIIDFGISRKIKPGEKVMETYGTPEFVAPEIIEYKPISTSTDMWSVGVITYILLSGASPFLGDNKQDTFTNITNIDYSFDDEYFSHTSELAKDFIRKLFVRDPRKRATVKDCLNHPWIKPRIRKDEEDRRQAQINIEQFKSFIARRRWKVKMHCESRSVRTITTNYRDSEGNVRSKRRAELSGKSEIYEGEYSETDSENENDVEKKASSSTDGNWMNTKQKIYFPQNIELKPVKLVEFNESIDDDDENASGNADSKDLSKRVSDMQERITERLSKLHQKEDKKRSTTGDNKSSTSASNTDDNNNRNRLASLNDDTSLVSRECKQTETSDTKTYEQLDEKSGATITASVTNRVNTKEDTKVNKINEEEKLEETDDMIVKKITTKTRTTKTVTKTTTTTTKKAISQGSVTMQ